MQNPNKDMCILSPMLNMLNNKQSESVQLLPGRGTAESANILLLLNCYCCRFSPVQA
jgi:hypothetical protein